LKKNWLNIQLAMILLASPIAMCQEAIAQEILAEAPNNSASSLTGTTPATSSTNNSFENSGNGIQNVNNGNNFSGTLTVPNCTSRACVFSLLRSTTNGSEAIIGAILNLGSTEDDRIAIERLKLELEGKKNLADLKLALLAKLTAAIDSGNSVRIRAIAISLAPLAGYSDFREYLKAFLNE
jgi:hypothetical protein